ncbi:MAG: AMP-binding protein [Planctomycetales bacterium]|nr:AMP-binding protein [Planctomycetales bacterium]
MLASQLSPRPQTAPLAACWQWGEEQLKDWQLQQLNAQLRAVLPTNRFYQQKFGSQNLQLSDWAELSQLPLTTKQELVQSVDEGQQGLAAHHTYEQSRYSRIHRTSGTTGQPLMIFDTAEDWQWWSATWQHVLQAAGVTGDDRVFMAFSFGPFIGFWSAHQACVDRGATVVPGGGLSSLARLEFMRQARTTIVCCTPSYALHLAEIARQESFPLQDIGVRRLIVAGEAGGSVSAVREKMEQEWQAQVVDHSGATEIGPWGFGWPDRSGLHVIETSFIAEFLPLEQAAHSIAQPQPGLLQELVLTSLGRYGAPVFRYRTGDVVQWQRNAQTPCRFLWLPQGVVGRADNMVTIRGVNIFPSSLDAIIRELPHIGEYRVLVTRSGQLDQLHIEIEGSEPSQLTLEKVLATRLGLRIPVQIVADHSLPRSELKSRRWLDRR